MVICATLTSLRRFFKHVAPKLIGERSGGSTSDSQKKGSQLVTFGGTGGAHLRYNKFPHSHGPNDDDEAYGMDNMIVSRINEHPAKEDRASGDDNSGDGNSQKGILQTHTTAITFEPRPTRE